MFECLINKFRLQIYPDEVLPAVELGPAELGCAIAAVEYVEVGHPADLVPHGLLQAVPLFRPWVSRAEHGWAVHRRLGPERVLGSSVSSNIVILRYWHYVLRSVSGVQSMLLLP